jgi:hypothetical protein
MEAVFLVVVAVDVSVHRLAPIHFNWSQLLIQKGVHRRVHFSVLRGPTEQLHVVELGGRHSLFDGALNHDVAGPTLVEKSGLFSR